MVDLIDVIFESEENGTISSDTVNKLLSVFNESALEHMLDKTKAELEKLESDRAKLEQKWFTARGRESDRIIKDLKYIDSILPDYEKKISRLEIMVKKSNIKKEAKAVAAQQKATKKESNKHLHPFHKPAMEAYNDITMSIYEKHSANEISEVEMNALLDMVHEKIEERVCNENAMNELLSLIEESGGARKQLIMKYAADQQEILKKIVKLKDQMKSTDDRSERSKLESEIENLTFQYGNLADKASDYSARIGISLGLSSAETLNGRVLDAIDSESGSTEFFKRHDIKRALANSKVMKGKDAKVEDYDHRYNTSKEYDVMTDTMRKKNDIKTTDKAAKEKFKEMMNKKSQNKNKNTKLAFESMVDDLIIQ